MGVISSAQLSSSESINSFPPTDADNQEQWFDTIDILELDEIWFDAREEIFDDGTPIEGAIAASIPLTEDCLRGLKQLINLVLTYKQNEFISAGLSTLFPTIPFNIIMAADNLYLAIVERSNLDLTLLSTLGLTSLYFPDDNNIVSQLALFIRKILIDAIGEGYFEQFLNPSEEYHFSYLNTALAVLAVTTRYWLTDARQPQRRFFQIPAFLGKLFIRTSMYWQALSRMTPHNPPHLPGASQHSAFTVDTCIAISRETNQQTFPPASRHLHHQGRLGAQEDSITFTSNSTVDPALLMQATVANKPTGNDREHAGLIDRLHLYAVQQLKQASKISHVMNCRTWKQETTQWDGQRLMTHHYVNTQCDALSSSSTSSTTGSGRHNLIPVPRVKRIPDPPASSAAHPQNREVILPLMIASATGSTLLSVPSGYNRKTVRVAATALSLTGISIAGKFLWRALSPLPQDHYRHEAYGKVPVEETNVIKKLHVPDFGAILAKYYRTRIQTPHANKTTVLMPQSNRKFNDLRTLFYSKKYQGTQSAVLRAIFSRAYRSDECRQERHPAKKRTVLLLKCLQITTLYLHEIRGEKGQVDHDGLQNVQRALVDKMHRLKNKRLIAAFQHFVIGSHTKDIITFGVADHAQLAKIIEKHLVIHPGRADRAELAMLITLLMGRNITDAVLIDIALAIFGNSQRRMNKELSVSIIHNYIFGSLLKNHLLAFLDVQRGITLSSALSSFLITKLQTALSASDIDKSHHTDIMDYITITLIPYYLPLLDKKTFPIDYELTSSAWGLMHAGKIYASRIGIDCNNLNQEDIYKIGILSFQLLSNRQLPSSWVDAFSLPAHVFYQLNTSDIDAVKSEKQQLEDYLQFLDTQVNTHLINENKLADFLQQLEQYQTISEFDNYYYKFYEGHYYSNGIDLAEQSNYMAHKAYEMQNHRLKIAFIKVDKEFLYAAMDELADADLEYLNTAEITQGEIIMHADYFPGMGKNDFFDLLPQPQCIRVDMEAGFATFIAKNNGEQRIYSLWKTPTGYVIRRTEQDVTIYKEHIFDKTGLYAFFSLTEIKAQHVIKKTGDTLFTFAQEILKPHADYFHAQITHLGQGKTVAEKARRMLIPFYDFVETVNERDIIGATLSFLSELSTLATPFLKSASFLLRYGKIIGKQSFSTGVLIATKLGKESIKIVLKKASQEFIRKGLVPAAQRVSKKEIISLGVDLMQSFIPGFDLVHSLSSYASRKTFKSISSIEGVFSTQLKRSRTFSHRHFSLSMHGNYETGLKNLMSCMLTPRTKRSPGALNFLCLPSAKRKIITQLKNEVGRVTTHWNIAPGAKDPRVFAEEINILELLASKQKEELLAISSYTSAGSSAINMQLRTKPVSLLPEKMKSRISKMVTQYHQLEEYNGFSYRIMNAKNTAIERFKPGDIIVDKGFVSSSALLTNTQNWYASQWVKERKQITDGSLLIIYDHSVEKRIASNSLLADHILIKPDTKLKIVETGTIITTNGEIINVIAVKHYKKAKPALDIYSGERLSPNQ